MRRFRGRIRIWGVLCECGFFAFFFFCFFEGEGDLGLGDLGRGFLSGGNVLIGFIVGNRRCRG